MMVILHQKINKYDTEMKKTALIGASGFVGSAILNELLSRGYEVEALVRNPENVKVKSPGLRVVDSGVIPAEIMGGVKSLGEFYLNTLNNEKGIDWIFFSPAGSLEPGEATGNYRLGKDDLIVDANGESRITVGNYAKAMVDELETPAHHRERFTIGY